MRHALCCLLSAWAFSWPAVGDAQMDGYGPDAWQVVDVAPDDRLNARSGPGTGHIVLGTFPHDATGLQMTTCVPYVTMAQFTALTETQRAALPPRWCLVHSRDGETSGWVSARYLAEDSSGAQADPQPDLLPDPQIDAAIDVVRRLYHARLTGSPEDDPLSQTNARAYFVADVAARLATGPQADPVFGAQDYQITQIRIQPAPEQSMLRGMITIHADFHNFGQPQQAIIVLRIDPALEPPAPRIIRIEHDGWTFR